MTWAAYSYQQLPAHTAGAGSPNTNILSHTHTFADSLTFCSLNLVNLAAKYVIKSHTLSYGYTKSENNVVL